MQFGWPHHPKGREHDQIRSGVDREAPTEPDGHDEQAGQRRAEDPGRVHDGAVEHDRVGAFALRTISVTNERRKGLSKASSTPPIAAMT